MAIIKRWSIGELGKGPITIDNVTYTQGLDNEGKPGVQGYVPTDFVDWRTDNRPLIDLTDNDEKLNSNIELNSLQIGNGIFQELGNQFLASIVDNKMTLSEIYDIIRFAEERFKVINMQLPKGYRYFWTDIEDSLSEDFNTTIGSESTTDTARWYWKEYVDGNLTDPTFAEVDTSTVITDSGDRELVKEVLQNRVHLEGITPLHISSGVAFINGNYSTIADDKAVYDETSYHMVGSVKHYDTSSNVDTLIKEMEDEIKLRYPDANPNTWEVTLVVTEEDVTGVDPHDEYDFYVTIGSSTIVYHGQFIPLMVANIAWDNSPKLDNLYQMAFDIGEIIVPHPAQIYNIDRENISFREYDPRYKVQTSGYAYQQSADPNIIIRQSGRNFDCDGRGILPVNNVVMQREFEAKEATIDTSGAVGGVANVLIPIQNQSTQLELSYEFTQHIIQGEGRWDDFYGTWISGYEPDPYAIKNVTTIAEFDNAIYFAYHHKLYRLVQNPNLPYPHEGPSLDNISTSIDEGEFTFGQNVSVNDNRVDGNDSNDFDATNFISSIVTYDGWLYIGTSNGYLYRFQQGVTGGNNIIEQVTVIGNPADLQFINALYVWQATNQLAIGTDQGFRLLKHIGGIPSNVTIEDLGTESPPISFTKVTAFTEVSKYGAGFVQTLIIGTQNKGIYYYGDRDFNSGREFHHDDNYTNFVLDGSGDVQFAPDFSNNYCTIKKFIKHKSQQDSNIYMLVELDNEISASDWDDDFGHHTVDDNELWRLIDGNNEGDHESFAYQRINLYESTTWKIGNLLKNADFELGVPPTNWSTQLGSGTFTKTENGKFNLYKGQIHNPAANSLRVFQNYAPAGGLGITAIESKTFTFSIYMDNLNASSASVTFGIEGLDGTGINVLDSQSSTISITSQNVWNRYSVSATFSSTAIVQARVYVEATTAVDIGIDAARFEEGAVAKEFNSGGIDETDFTPSKHACSINDMISFNDHIILGGERDIKGEYGGQKDEPGYTYPPGAPADEEYPSRPDGGINSGIDTVDGNSTNTIDEDVIDYLSSNEGLYYIDQLMLYNTAYGTDFFTFFQDSHGTVWAGSKSRLFKVHSEVEASSSDYVSLYDDSNVPLTFRAIIKIPASDNIIQLTDPASPQWHTFISNALLQDVNKDKIRLIKGSVFVRNAPNSRVDYIEGRDYEIEYDPNSPNYGKIKRKPNPLYEMTGYGRIEPDQQVYIEYKYFKIYEEVAGSEEGYKDLNIEDRTATINLPGSVLEANYELFCDFIYTKIFKGIDDTNVNFNTPITGIKYNLKPYDYVTDFISAHVWTEKFHIIAYSRNQRIHPIYSSYKFSIPRVDIIQLNENWDEEGFVTSITMGEPEEGAPQEPNPSIFDETALEDAISGSGGTITRQHVWEGYVPTTAAIKMYTMNVSQQDYFLNDIYDKRYYITKLQLWDYFIGIKSDTAAYFPFSRSFVSSNGKFIPEPKVPGDPTSAVQNSTIEEITSENLIEFADFPGEFDEQEFYDSESEFKVWWEYTPDYFGLSLVDEYGVRKWRADGLPDNPGIPRGLYVISAKSTGVAFDNKNALQINRNMTISQSFLDSSSNPTLPKDIYRFDIWYFLENAYNASSSSYIELRVYYDEEGATGEQYYSTTRAYTGSSDDLIEDKLNLISVTTEAAIIPKRIEIIISGWDESDEFGGGDPRYVGGTHFFAGNYKAKLNLYLSGSRFYRTGIDTTKFYQSAARIGERITYPVPLNGLAGSMYFKFKPLWRYNLNEVDNSSIVVFDSRSITDTENYFQVIYDAKNYNTQEALAKDDFYNLGTDTNPYPRWPAEGGNYYNSFKVVFYARQMNIQQGDINFKYRSYALDTNSTDNKTRLKYDNNEDLQLFHTFLITWQRLDEMYPDEARFSDGFNNWQFLMTLFLDDQDPISKLIIIDPNFVENLTEKIQIGGGWLKQSYNPATETVTWREIIAEGFLSEFRVENTSINYDKAKLWINKRLPFLDANNIPVFDNIITLGNETELINGTTGAYADMRLNDMFVEGDLYVMGTEVINNVSKMIIEDNIVEVNRIQEFDEDGNWIGIPNISSPAQSGLKSYRQPDEETYDSSFIWNEVNDEWDLIELSKFDILYGDNVLAGASWSVNSGTGTGIDNSIYTIITKSDNNPTPMYQHSEGTWTLQLQLKSSTTPLYARIYTVAQLHDLTEVEHHSNEFQITTSYTDQLFRIIYENNEVDQITVYIEVITSGASSASIQHQNESFAKTTIDLTNYEIPHETQDLRLRKVIIAAPIANPAKEASITFENGKSAIKVFAQDGIYINNDTLVDSMVLRTENDPNSNVELQVYNSGGSLGSLRMNAVRPNYIESIVDNSEITVFSGKIGGVQKYNLQLSKSGHIEPGMDANSVYFSVNNDTWQTLRIDQNAELYFRKAHLTNESEPNSASPLVANVIESALVDLNDNQGAQDCVKITKDQSGTGAVEPSPIIISEFALHNNNSSNGIRYMQSYKLVFNGRVSGAPGHTQASINHNLNIPQERMVVSIGTSSPLRHVYWDPVLSNANTLVVKLDDENTMITTNDINPSNWIDPNDGKIIVFVTISEQIPITSGITMS